MQQVSEQIDSTHFIIGSGDVRAAESMAMLARLTAELAARYNDDGVGDFRPEDLDQQGSGFLVGRWDTIAVACGAYRPLESDIGEIKRMYVDPAYRGKGIGRKLLAVLEERARLAGYARIWLETGTRQPEAVKLYESTGYRRIEPYGFYRWDPRSICFEKLLTRKQRTNGPRA